VAVLVVAPVAEGAARVDIFAAAVMGASVMVGGGLMVVMVLGGGLLALGDLEDGLAGSLFLKIWAVARGRMQW